MEASRVSWKEIRSVFIDDGTHIVYSHITENHAPVEVEDIEKYVDRYAGNGVDVLGLDLCFGDVTWFVSEVGEMASDENWTKPLTAAKGHSAESFGRPARTMAHMKAKGIDLPAMLAERAHHHGFRFMPAVRMNFAKFPSRFARSLMDDPSAFVTFDRKILDQGTLGHDWSLNYAHPKVYAHRLAIFQELIQRYDVDGIILDFRGNAPKDLVQRWRSGLCNPFEQTFATITHLLRDLRGILDDTAKAGGKAPLALAVGVPHTLAWCQETGLDVPTWIGQGLVDLLLVKPYNGLDPTVPIEEFLALSGAERCCFYPGFTAAVGPPYRDENRPAPARQYGCELIYTEPTWRPALAHYQAAVHNFNRAGAAGWSSMNLPSNPIHMDITRHLHDPDEVARARHHYLFHFRPDEIDSTEIGALAIPITQERHALRIRIGDDLSQRSPSYLVVLTKGIVDAEHLEVDLNGEPVALRNEPVDNDGHFFVGVVSTPPAKIGDNEFGVKLSSGARVSEDGLVTWIELAVPAAA